MNFSIKANKIARKALAGIVSSMILVVPVTCVCGVQRVYAQTERTGYWKYIGSEVEGPRENFDGATMSGGNGHYQCNARCIDDVRLDNHEGSCQGESVSITIDVSEPPKGIIQPGEEVSMTVSASFSASSPHDGLMFYVCNVDCSMGTNEFHNSEIRFETSDGEKYLGLDRTWEANDYYGYGGHLMVKGGDQTFRANVPDGREGQILWIRQSFGHGRGEDAINTYYNYEWVDTTPAVTPPPEPVEWPGDDIEEDTSSETEESDEASSEDTEDDEKKVDIVINTDANSDPGEQDGGSFPAGIVEGWKKFKDAVGTAGAVAGAVGATVVGLSSGEEDADDERRKKYRMVVYKNFGDTIKRGEQVIVYAAIMESNPEGGEQVNHELTRHISIFSDDDVFYIKEQKALAGDYKGATVTTSDKQGSYALEGRVCFKYTGKGGSFTNRMKFKIAGAELYFGQENIALPHDLKEPEKPWFVVIGMPDKPEITAEIITPEVYSVNVTEAESTGISGVWAFYANIIPLSGAPSMEDREPGGIETYKLHVVAKGKDNLEAEGDLEIIRVRTGLTLTTKHIDCFWKKTTNMEVFDEKSGGDGTKWFKTTYTDYVYTVAELKLIIFDREEHKMRVVAPVPLENGLELIADNDSEQNIIKRLGVVFDAGAETPEFGPEGGLKITMFAHKAQLDAPRRIMAKLRISAKAFDKIYTAEQDIQLCSQPNRSKLDFEQFSLALKEDEKVMERLEHLRNYIQRNCYDNLFPLHKMITDLIDSYDGEYGFDEERVGFIFNTFNRYSRGYILGANGKPDEGESLTDYALWAICAAGDAMDRFESKFPFLVRLGLGFATGGFSEGVFLTFDFLRVPYRMVQALERGKSDVTFFGKKLGEVDSDSILGLTVAGAHDLVMGDLQGKVFNGALSLGWSVGKTLTKGFGEYKFGKSIGLGWVSNKMTMLEKGYKAYNQKLQTLRANNDIFKGSVFEGAFKSSYKPEVDPNAVKARAAKEKMDIERIRNMTDDILRKQRQTNSGDPLGKVEAATEHGVYVQEMPDGSLKAVGLDLSDPFVANRQQSLKTLDAYQKAVNQARQAFSPEAKAEANAKVSELEFEIMSNTTTHRMLNEMNGTYSLDYKYTYAQHSKKFKADANRFACEYTFAELKSKNPKLQESDIYMKSITTNKDSPYKDGLDLDQTQMIKQGDGLPDIEVGDTLQYKNNVKGVYKARTGKELTDANFKEGEALYEKLNCETVAGEGQFAKEKFSDVDGVLNPKDALREIKNAVQNADVMAYKTQVFVDKANAATTAEAKGGYLGEALYATNKGAKRTIVMRNDIRVDKGMNDALTDLDKVRLDAIERGVEGTAPDGHLNMYDGDSWQVLNATGIKNPSELSAWMKDLTLRVSGGVPVP